MVHSLIQPSVTRRSVAIQTAIALMLGLGLLNHTSQLTAQVRYSIHALDEVILDGVQHHAFAKDVTDTTDGFRWVVGYAQSDRTFNAPLMWTVDSTGASLATALEYPQDLFVGAVASAIANNHRIIGGGQLDYVTGASIGLCWPDPSSAPLVLPGLQGETASVVQQINDEGVIVGFSRSAIGTRAVAWRILADDTIVGPLVLPTKPRSASNDDAALAVGPTVANITQIVGRSAGAAVVWRVRSTVNSLTLEAPIEVLDATGEATGIASAGAVCGNDRSRSVIWEARTGSKRSKTSLHFDSSVFATPGKPTAMNDRVAVIGYANLNVNYPASRAVIWTSRTARMQTLESLADGSHLFANLESAVAINSDSEVVGYGRLSSNATYQAFIAVPDSR